MKVRKTLFVVLLLVLMFFSLAFQVENPNPWREIFGWIIGIVVLFLGAPITQYLKNALGLKDKMALLLTGTVAVVLAVAELLLTNMLQLSSFTLENFPLAFSAVFTVATIYFKLLKESDSVFGKQLLLPESNQ